MRYWFNSAFSSGGIGNILFSLISFFPFYPRFYVLFYPGCTQVETPKPEHPETTEKPEEKDVHANHVEAFNSAIRRYLAAFRRRTNTYAKSVVGLQRVLDIFWMVHNFVRSHFTTREVPAVALGIIEKGFTWEDLLQIRLIC
ncbi:MAG: hypothetical protein KA717_36485 [Woronichinia naegeliana WA131]|uniref:Uncharacterized protein n=1 Tax=Woronichinia naegeliana WA131 TaxID=2824559 RepID=A0A977KYS9_9CYAN|nr:MAG: hypothetical protein KA717_36485 [Woronichinia naegeliana WA131]